MIYKAPTSIKNQAKKMSAPVWKKRYF